RPPAAPEVAMLQFEFTYRLIVHGQVIDESDKSCVAIIEPDRVDGGWCITDLMVDWFLIPSIHLFYDELYDCAMRHRARITVLWAERQRQRALEPGGV